MQQATRDIQTYTNPVGTGIEMGDPFVMKHDGVYYLTGSTAGDGFKGWRSTDLVHWEPLGYLFRRTESTWGARSFWAPELTHYRGSFYLAYSVAPPKGSFLICIAKSDTPEGPYEDLHAPLFDPGHGCIDAHLFIDHDNTPYLFYDEVGTVGTPSKTEDSGYMYGVIHAVQLSEDLSSLVGEPVECSRAEQPWENPQSSWSRCNEGAFVFRDDATCYLTYSAGHYADPTYGIGYATAPHPLGPWTKSPHNPLIARNLDAGISGPGHSCMVSSPDDSELFIVYHAHADPTKPSGRRVVCIDRAWVASDGVLKTTGPTRTPQPMPR